MFKDQSTYEQPLTKNITLLQALTATPASIARLLEGVDEATARQSLAPDQWSMADILNHLADVETRYQARLQEVLQAEQPDLPAIWPEEGLHDSQASPNELLDRFRAARLKTLSFLRNRSPEDWQRPAIHETFGETTFRFLVQNLVDHDTIHLNQLAELQQQICQQPQKTV